MSVRAENSNLEVCEATGKLKYRSKAKATVHCNRIGKRNRTHGDRYPVHVYPCAECDGFHVGHDVGLKLKGFARIRSAG